MVCMITLMSFFLLYQKGDVRGGKKQRIYFRLEDWYDKSCKSKFKVFSVYEKKCEYQFFNKSFDNIRDKIGKVSKHKNQIRDFSEVLKEFKSVIDMSNVLEKKNTVKSMLDAKIILKF